ncbi:hypothetical protein V1509DRAFT_618738 [Lipomyces kononenkoae]
MDDRATLGKLAVAKATLSAELLRPHQSGTPSPVSSDVIKKLHGALDAALRKNSVENVRSIKYLILDHISPFTSRAAALGKYLTALSPTLSTRHAKLFILYIINDVLYHTTYISKSGEEFKSGIQQFLPTLFAIPWHMDNIRGQVEELVEIWKEKEYFHTFFLQSLTDPATLEQWRQTSGESSQRTQKKDTKEADLEDTGKIPPVLGIQAMQYFELPVSTMLPCIQGAMPVAVSGPRPTKLRLNDDGMVNENVMSAVDSFYRCLEWKGGRFREAEEKAGEEEKEEEFAYEGWSMGFLKAKQDEEIAMDKGRSRSGSIYSDEGSLYSRQSRSRSRSKSNSSHHYRSRSRTRSPSASYSPPEPSQYDQYPHAAYPTRAMPSQSLVHEDRESDGNRPADSRHAPHHAPPPPPPPPYSHQHLHEIGQPSNTSVLRPGAGPPPRASYSHGEYEPHGPPPTRRVPWSSEFSAPKRDEMTSPGPSQARPSWESSRDRAAQSYMHSVYGSREPEEQSYPSRRR